MKEFKHFLQVAKALAIEAGEIQLNYFRSKNYEIDTKSCVADVVTQVDKECEQHIVGKIREHFPDHSILGEEGANFQGNEYQWVIDPLDGTNNFSQGLPVFTVSIALQLCGETIVGVVYAPYFNELFVAVRGKGATLNGENISVSSKSSLRESVLGTGFPYDKSDNSDNNSDNLASILPQLRGVRRMGSAAYDLACVAAGFLDGYWELALQPWDMCAGALLVEEAGGQITHFRNDRGVSIVASGAQLTDEILKYIH